MDDRVDPIAQGAHGVKVGEIGEMEGKTVRVLRFTNIGQHQVVAVGPLGGAEAPDPSGRAGDQYFAFHDNVFL